MSRRRGMSIENYRKFHGPDLLKMLGETRRQLCGASIPLNTAEYRAAGEIIARIDDLAELLTGDRTHFHLKAGPSPYPYGPSSKPPGA
ncbi:hypothetical protein [Microvirga zambiensis]|uniref:hypothetical protein n=1 Tax=Microvirga zambiensis TaxID=1402137 RepID=UPI00191CBFA7|nr:hypothetical protein [Microvirga zambiensis]